MQRLLLQGPDAVAIQVEVLEGRQTIKSVPMDLRDLVLVEEDRMQMHFAGKHVGGHIPYVVVAQISGKKRAEQGVGMRLDKRRCCWWMGACEW